MIFVLESIFSFDLSLPLNYLLEDFEDKTLVIQVRSVITYMVPPKGLYFLIPVSLDRLPICQGMKDPLSDSKSTLAMFREHCRGVLVKEIDAGNSTTLWFSNFLSDFSIDITYF